jgi:hypothetical protein
MQRCRGASDALSRAVDIGSSLFESKLSADDLNLIFDLEQDGEVIGVDQNVSGILGGGEIAQSLVGPKANLFR